MMRRCPVMRRPCSIQSRSKRVGDVSVARGLEGMTVVDFLDKILMAASCNGGIGNFYVRGQITLDGGL
jgi:hypothetical protein